MDIASKKNVKLRKYKKMFASCGSDLLIYGKPRVNFPQRIELGDGVTLNDGCILNATPSHITIGNNVTISADAKILATTYDVDEFFDKQRRRHIDKSITIGDNVWISADAIICPGVKIMPGGVIVAAGAIVTHDITESNVIVAGNPAQIVKKVQDGRTNKI